MADPVIITDNIRHALSSVIRENEYSAVAVLVDENTSRDCFPLISNLIPDVHRIEIPSGEENKNIRTCEQIWNELTAAEFDRNGLMLNLGGGVIGDMGGFCAATYKRGIPFINIPTTLLAQVDASVGGKLGIDFRGYKNHIGLFSLPVSVLIDTKFLDTLPERELRSGFAEIIKHYLIADKEQWQKLCQSSFKDQPWNHHVEQSVRIKSAVVKEDPHESGWRKALNFGHTAGHALETFFLNQNKHSILHGEAIAAGMICELYISGELLSLGENEIEPVTEYILKVFGKLPLEKKHIGEVLRIARQDKKNYKGNMHFTLLPEIGKASINVPVTENQAEKGLMKYYER